MNFIASCAFVAYAIDLKGVVFFSHFGGEKPLGIDQRYRYEYKTTSNRSNEGNVLNEAELGSEQLHLVIVTVVILEYYDTVAIRKYLETCDELCQ